MPDIQSVDIQALAAALARGDVDAAVEIVTAPADKALDNKEPPSVR